MTKRQRRLRVFHGGCQQQCVLFLAPFPRSAASLENNDCPILKKEQELSTNGTGRTLVFTFQFVEGLRVIGNRDQE
jgi:hypothetical protein